MPIDLRNQNNQKIDHFFHPEQQIRESQQQQSSHINVEQIRDRAYRRYNKDVLMDWKAQEFEVYEKSFWWYFVAAVLDIAIVAYALISNNPIMAITFILAGIVGYIYLEKDPQIIHFAITPDGVIAGNELYSYENIHSFWIFYDPPHTKTLSLHTKGSMFPFVHIPIDDQNPVQMHELLSEYIPEIKQEPGLTDTFERVLHI